MSISLRNVGGTDQKANAGGSSTSPQVTLPNTPAQGNLLVCFVSSDSAATALSANTGWTMLTQVSPASQDRTALFYKVAGASESATLSPCTAGNAGWNCHGAEFVLSAGSWELNAENAAEDSTGTTKTSPSVTPASGAEILVVGAAGTNATGGSPWSGQNVSGTAATELGDRGTNATSSTLFYLVVASSSGSYYAEAVASAAGTTGAAHIAVFKAAGTTQTGAATVAAVSSVSTAGTLLRYGAATVAAVSSVSTAGALVHFGQALVAAAATVAASGVATLVGAAQVAAAATVSATGTGGSIPSPAGTAELALAELGTAALALQERASAELALAELGSATLTLQ